MEQSEFSRRRLIGGVFSAALVAGTAGGAIGSAVTAATLSRGPLAPAVASAAPPAIIRTSANAALPDTGIKAIYRQVSPAVVSVENAASISVRGLTPRQGRPNQPGLPSVPSLPGGQTPGSQLLPQGEGTGFIIDPDGSILTNAGTVTTAFVTGWPRYSSGMSTTLVSAL